MKGMERMWQNFCWLIVVCVLAGLVACKDYQIHHDKNHNPFGRTYPKDWLDDPPVQECPIEIEIVPLRKDPSQKQKGKVELVPFFEINPFDRRA